MTEPTTSPEPADPSVELPSAAEEPAARQPPDPYAERAARDQLLGPGDDPD